MIPSLLKSGFPFQLAVQHVVNPSLGCTVAAYEYWWRTSDGESHFLDIVGRKDDIFLTIECKRSDEPLTFLRWGARFSTISETVFRCLRAAGPTAQGAPLSVFCEEWNLFPQSICSAFCVTSRDRERLIEKEIGLPSPQASAATLPPPR